MQNLHRNSTQVEAKESVGYLLSKMQNGVLQVVGRDGCAWELFRP